ncbi:glycosyltransferase family 39 protein [Thermodesulfobacteriota bacterium]
MALILRVSALLSLSGSIYFDYLLWDERLYHDWASSILNGNQESFIACDFAPLPAYFMALIYRLFSPDILYVRLLNIIFGVLTCFIVYLIGKELANRKIGLISCLIAALYEPFIFYSVVPLKAAMSVFLFALTVYLFVAVLDKGSRVKALLLGVAIGLMLNVRPNGAVLIPVLPLLIIWSMFKGKSPLKTILMTIILFFAGVAISMTPFTVRSYRISGEFHLTTPQSGFNLFLGNNLKDPDSYYNPVPFASSQPFEQGIQFAIEASRRAGKKLTPSEASSFWTREVLRTAMEQPAAFLWKICQKTLALFNRFESGEHYQIVFMRDFLRFLKIPFFSLWLILPFGVAGLAMNAFRSKKLFAIGIIFFCYSLTLIIYFTTTRYRLPLLVILIPIAVIGVENLIQDVRIRAYKRVVIFFTTVTAFFIIEFVPLTGTDDMTPYYNTHAIILDSRGFEDEAIKYWKKSADMKKSSSACANYSLSVKSILRQDIQKAFGYLDKIGGNSFFSAPKYELIGDVMMHARQIDNAISAYERSLDINSGQQRIRLKLAKIFWGIDKKRALEEYAKFEYLSSFYKPLQRHDDKKENAGIQKR